MDFDLVSHEFRQNPYPTYARIRDQPRLQRSEQLGVWLVARYENVVETMRAPQLSSRRAHLFSAQLPEAQRRSVEPLVRGMAQWMLFQDPPDHSRLRALVSKAFTPRIVEAQRGAVTELVESLLSPFLADGRMDVMTSIAGKLPIMVILQMLGVPAEHHPTFMRCAGVVASFIGGGRRAAEQHEAASDAWSAMAARFRAVIADRRVAPREDLISGLVAAEENGDVLSEDELVAMCILLFGAGNATTKHLIGNGLVALLRHPDQLRELVRSPELIDDAVEELLRYDGPLQYTQRIVLEDATFAGVTFSKGDRVRAFYGAANRDERQYRDPETLLLRRRGPRHLAFGYGGHFCVGAALARLEGKIAISAISQLPGLRLATESITWDDNAAFRGVLELPVAFESTPRSCGGVG